MRADRQKAGRRPWADASRDERAVLLQAVRAAADDDRRFSTLLARLRTANRSISESEAPHVAEELRRHGLPGPAAPPR